MYYSRGLIPDAFGGLKVQVVRDWPQVQKGFRTVRFDVHPIVQFLSRFTPIKPYIEAEYPNYVDDDPKLFMGRTLLCSAAQYQDLKELTHDK
tara:strand:- start:34 stop:309 length:276 start_codon:yes stop_codon:yes gene_type:complete